MCTIRPTTPDLPTSTENHQSYLCKGLIDLISKISSYIISFFRSFLCCGYGTKEESIGRSNSQAKFLQRRPASLDLGDNSSFHSSRQENQRKSLSEQKNGTGVVSSENGIPGDSSSSWSRLEDNNSDCSGISYVKSAPASVRAKSSPKRGPPEFFRASSCFDDDFPEVEPESSKSATEKKDTSPASADSQATTHSIQGLSVIPLRFVQTESAPISPISNRSSGEIDPQKEALTTDDIGQDSPLKRDSADLIFSSAKKSPDPCKNIYCYFAESRKEYAALIELLTNIKERLDANNHAHIIGEIKSKCSELHRSKHQIELIEEEVKSLSEEAILPNSEEEEKLKNFEKEVLEYKNSLVELIQKYRNKYSQVILPNKPIVPKSLEEAKKLWQSGLNTNRKSDN